MLRIPPSVLSYPAIPYLHSASAPGISFGMVTVGGNTVVIDIMPSARRGEGLGYYGLANNLAMSIGPMFGLFLHSAGTSYIAIFSYGLGSCVLGFIAASMVKTPYKPPVKREPISLDRFILIKALSSSKDCPPDSACSCYLSPTA